MLAAIGQLFLFLVFSILISKLALVLIPNLEYMRRYKVHVRHTRALVGTATASKPYCSGNHVSMLTEIHPYSFAIQGHMKYLLLAQVLGGNRIHSFQVIPSGDEALTICIG